MCSTGAHLVFQEAHIVLDRTTKSARLDQQTSRRIAQCPLKQRRAFFTLQRDVPHREAVDHPAGLHWQRAPPPSCSWGSSPVTVRYGETLGACPPTSTRCWVLQQLTAHE